MRHIKKILTRNERILAITRPHWISVIIGFFWFAVLTAGGVFADKMLYRYAGLHTSDFEVDLYVITFTASQTPIPWLFGVTGLIIFINHGLHYLMDRISLTNQRFIYRKGLIFVEIDQVDLEDISAEYVYEGWFGWAFEYGRIRLNCRFVEDLWLPNVAKPYKLIKLAHMARTHHPALVYSKDDLRSNLHKIDRKKASVAMRKKMRQIKRAFKRTFQHAASKVGDQEKSLLD